MTDQELPWIKSYIEVAGCKNDKDGATTLSTTRIDCRKIPEKEAIQLFKMRDLLKRIVIKKDYNARLEAEELLNKDRK